MTQHGHLQVLELMTNRLREIDERILSLTGEVRCSTTHVALLVKAPCQHVRLDGWSRPMQGFRDSL